MCIRFFLPVWDTSWLVDAYWKWDPSWHVWDPSWLIADHFWHVWDPIWLDKTLNWFENVSIWDSSFQFETLPDLLGTIPDMFPTYGLFETLLDSSTLRLFLTCFETLSDIVEPLPNVFKLLFTVRAISYHVWDASWVVWDSCWCFCTIPAWLRSLMTYLRHF